MEPLLAGIRPPDMEAVGSISMPDNAYIETSTAFRDERLNLSSPHWVIHTDYGNGWRGIDPGVAVRLMLAAGTWNVPTLASSSIWRPAKLLRP